MDRLKIIAIALIGLVVIIIAFIAITGIGLQPTGGPSAQPVELTFWGVFDYSDAYETIISDYQKTNKNVKITYRKQTVGTYEKDLLNAMAAGRGPDIFMLHNTWLPKHADKIVSLPSELMSLKDFQNTFVDAAYDDFVEDGKIYGLPISVDTLALFYNKDIFNSAGLTSPPQTWENFVEASNQTVKTDNQGNILRAGAALGTARNVNRASDILMLLMLQSGVEMVDPETGEAAFDQSVVLEGAPYAAGQTALQFYTDFANPKKRAYTWNSLMPYSIDAFTEGRAAMMLNYSYQIPTIRAKSPQLNFGVSFAPQPAGAAKKINFPNYWAYTVAAKSPNGATAWNFLTFLTNREEATNYINKTQKPAARRDLINLQKTGAELGVFAEQALSAKNWRQVDNLAIENIFNDMIESVVLGRSTVSEALKTAADQVTILMR